MTKVNFFSSPWKSGAGWFNRELARAIAGCGMEVTFISPMAEPESNELSGPDIHRMVIPGGPSQKGGALYKVGRGLNKLMAAFGFFKIAAKKSKVFVYSFYDFIALCVLHFLYIKSKGGKILYVVHDATPHAYSFPALFRFVELYLLRLSYKLPDKLVTLTSAARLELIEKYGVSSSKISVIPHGAFVPAQVAPAKGTGQILLFGSLRRNKRIREAILAFQTHQVRFPDLSLLIAGGIHEDDRAYWEDCARLIAKSGGRIRADVGFVTEARLADLIAESDALLLAYEDFNSQSGVAVLAAFAERPIIGTVAGGIGELADHGLDLIPVATPVSPQAIADALEAFGKIPLLQRQIMATQSREALKSYLSWENIGAQYAYILQSL